MGLSIKTIMTTLVTIGFLVIIGIVMIGVQDPTGISSLMGGMLIIVAILSGLTWFAGNLKHFK